MHSNPQRLAWMVMTGAFVIWCALAVGIPLGGWNFVRNSEVELPVNLVVGSGTVRVTRPGRVAAEGVVDRLTDVPEGALIQTDESAQAILSFLSPKEGQALGAAQIYGGTTVRLNAVRSPRFEVSPRGYRIILRMDRGRARVSLLPSASRMATITLETPQGQVSLDQAGSYSVEVTEQETQVTVRDGQATAQAAGGVTVVETNQRTVIPSGLPPQGALPPERNLLVNSDFSAGLDTAWSVYADRYDPADQLGLAQLTESRGRLAIQFIRDGRNWGQVGVRQELNRDVRDIRELRLHLAALIVRQDLVRCGTLGSECPVMAKIEFLDTSGTRREWLQGFYSDSPFLADVPTSCVTCPPPKGPHIRIQRSTWYIYDSPNLIEAMTNEGLTPASVIAVSIYASGHLFESMVAEVELLALE